RLRDRCLCGRRPLDRNEGGSAARRALLRREWCRRTRPLRTCDPRAHRVPVPIAARRDRRARRARRHGVQAGRGRCAALGDRSRARECGIHRQERAMSDAPTAAVEAMPRGHWLHKLLRPLPELPAPIDPALLAHERARAEARQNRIADAITAFSGSMLFVYLHVAWFACWIGFGVEHYPYGLLTMIVSLEAIFLSTFVMISQNRADAKRQVIADEQWTTVQKEQLQNVELLNLSRQILALTKDVRELARSDKSGGASS